MPSAYLAQRRDQPHVPDRVRELRTPGGLQVGQQVKLARGVCPVMQAAQRNAAGRIAAPAARARNQVCRIDSMVCSTYDAAPSGDGCALTLGDCH